METPRVVVEMGAEDMAVVEEHSCSRDVNGNGSVSLQARRFCELVDMGFAGVQNFPTVGLIRWDLQGQSRGDPD